MTDTDLAYYEQRARREREIAAKSRNPALAELHETFARRYDARVAAASRASFLA